MTTSSAVAVPGDATALPHHESTPAERPSNAADLAPALLEALRQQFPVLANFRPLRIGVHLDIIAVWPEVDRATLKVALRWHVSRSRYLRNLAKGGDRYDLDGQPAGPISEEHRRTRDGWKPKPKKSAPKPALAEKPDAPKAPPAEKPNAPKPAPAKKPDASPPAVESPPMAVPTPGRPTLKLKPKNGGPVLAVTLTRKARP